MIIQPGESTGINRFAIGVGMINPPEQRKHPGKKATQEKNEQRILTKYIEELCKEALCVFKFNQMDHYGEDHNGQAGSVQYI